MQCTLHCCTGYQQEQRGAYVPLEVKYCNVQCRGYQLVGERRVCTSSQNRLPVPPLFKSAIFNGHYVASWPKFQHHHHCIQLDPDPTPPSTGSTIDNKAQSINHREEQYNTQLN